MVPINAELSLDPHTHIMAIPALGARDKWILEFTGGLVRAQWIKVLEAKPDGLDLIPRTHVVKERTNSHCGLWIVWVLCSSRFVCPSRNLLSITSL